jgi:hypothetical protein
MSRVNRGSGAIGVDARPFAIIHDSQTFDVEPGRFLDVIHLMYYEMVWHPYELYDFVICKPEAEFDIGAGWGHLVECKVDFNKGNVLDLRGKPEDLALALKEIENGGDAVKVLADGPHPNDEEAKKGFRQTVIEVQSSRKPKCRVKGKILEVYDEEGAVLCTMGQQ